MQGRLQIALPRCSERALPGLRFAGPLSLPSQMVFQSVSNKAKSQTNNNLKTKSPQELMNTKHSSPGSSRFLRGTLLLGLLLIALVGGVLPTPEFAVSLFRTTVALLGLVTVVQVVAIAYGELPPDRVLVWTVPFDLLALGGERVLDQPPLLGERGPRVTANRRTS